MQDDSKSYQNLNEIADTLTCRIEGILDCVDNAEEVRRVEARKADCPYSSFLARIDLKLCYHEKMLKWIIGMLVGGFSMIVSILLAWMGLS